MKGLNENQYARHRTNLEGLLEELSKSGIKLEDLLENRDFQWSKIPHDATYITLLEAKTKELYGTLYSDPFNDMQRYFPYGFDSFGECSKLWWMALVYKAQVIQPAKAEGKPK
ncbi:MAG: hypothetical protein DRQ56_05820 [Gammaproteobacteria bacterium]|nr:MAG: hypothetical protein DRQ56_05820 [Gammaproteobacteria bacterium]